MNFASRYLISLSMLYVFICLFFSCKNNPGSGSDNHAKGTVNIGVKIAGQAPGLAQLIGVYTDQNFLADTLRIGQDGTIRIKKDSLFKSGLYFVVLPSQQNFQILLDSDQEFEVITDVNDLINTMKIEGSVDNDLLYQSLKMQASQDKQLQPLQQRAQGKPDTDPDVIAFKQLNREVRSARQKQLDEFAAKYPSSLFVSFKKAGQFPEVKEVKLANGQPDLNAQAFHFRNEYWNNTNLNDTRLIYTPVLANKLKQFFGDIVPQHQDSLNKQVDYLLTKALPNNEVFKYFSNWILFKYEPGKTSLMDGEAVFANVVNKFFTTENAKWLTPGDLRAIQQRANEMKGSLLNHKALDVVASDPAGNTKSIYEIKTPYIIVYLYHTDCEHCQELTPKLSKMYQQLKSRGVTVFTIAVNTTDSEWKKFIASYGMTDFINVFDPTNAAVYGKYFVDNTPEIYVLNKDRIIIGKNLKPEQINSIIDLDQQKK